MKTDDMIVGMRVRVVRLDGRCPRRLGQCGTVSVVGQELCAIVFDDSSDGYWEGIYISSVEPDYNSYEVDL
jgi:hypothetical protein